MAKFWDALLESTILQGVLALLFAITICYMYLIGMEVPESLTLILGAIIGFYFRTKASAEVRKHIASEGNPDGHRLPSGSKDRAH